MKSKPQRLIMTWLLSLILTFCFVDVSLGQSVGVNYSTPASKSVSKKKSKKKKLVKKSKRKKRYKKTSLRTRSKKRRKRTRRTRKSKDVYNLAMVDTKSQIKAKDTKEKKPSKRWGLGLKVGYQDGFYENIDPFGSFSVSANVKVTDSQKISVIQSWTKKFYIEPNEDEVQINDMSLGYSWTIAKDMFQGVGLSMNSGLTLPLSNYSKRNDIITRFGLGFSAFKPFMDGALNVSLSPYGRYYFNQFQTTSTNPGDGGGRPLTQHLYGISLGVNGSPFKSFIKNKTFLTFWSVSLSGGWSRSVNERVEFKNETSELGLENPGNNGYNWSLSTALGLYKGLSVATGIVHSDRVEKFGGYDIVAFDERITRWFLSTSYSF